MENTTTAAPLDRLMNESDAAGYLGVTSGMLRGLRVRGGGPVFAKVGRLVRYRLSSLDAWVKENERRSTSDRGARG